MALHEFDVTNHRWDKHKRVNPETTGETVATLVLDHLEEQGLQLPEDATYLALAAGDGVAERGFARTLGIPPARVVLLDKDFWLKGDLRKSYPGARLIERGMFAFLERPTTRDFSLVTAFGIEYLLGQKEQAVLTAQLPKILRSNAFVAAYPVINVETPEWERNGFDVLSASFYGIFVGQYRGKP